MKITLDIVQDIADVNLPRIIKHHGRLLIIHSSQVGLLEEAFRILHASYVLYTTPRQVKLS